MLTVYHGATDVISSPICAFGRPKLDFGMGFYVTDIKEQAVRWAQSLADKRNALPILNIYTLDREACPPLGSPALRNRFDEIIKPEE